MRRTLVIALALLALPALAAAAGPDFTQHGPLEVGRRIVRWTKASETTGEPRVLDTLIWYPAEAGSGSPDATTEDAPVAEGRFPVILFSHGSCGLPGQSPFYVETLASWGFVVAAPPHPGNQTVDPECVGGRDEDAITLVEQNGGAALLSLQQAGQNDKPASLLMVRSAAGWRLREIFDY